MTSASLRLRTITPPDHRIVFSLSQQVQRDGDNISNIQDGKQRARLPHCWRLEFPQWWHCGLVNHLPSKSLKSPQMYIYFHLEILCIIISSSNHLLFYFPIALRHWVPAASKNFMHSCIYLWSWSSTKAQKPDRKTLEVSAVVLAELQWASTEIPYLSLNTCPGKSHMSVHQQARRLLLFLLLLVFVHHWPGACAVSWFQAEPT